MYVMQQKNVDISREFTYGIKRSFFACGKLHLPLLDSMFIGSTNQRWPDVHRHAATFITTRPG